MATVTNKRAEHTHTKRDRHSTRRCLECMRKKNWNSNTINHNLFELFQMKNYSFSVLLCVRSSSLVFRRPLFVALLFLSVALVFNFIRGNFSTTQFYCRQWLCSSGNRVWNGRTKDTTKRTHTQKDLKRGKSRLRLYSCNHSFWLIRLV